MSDFTGAIQNGFSNYTDFEGRAPRPQFWYWALFIFLLSVATNMIDGLVIDPLLGFSPFDPDAGNPLSLLVSLLLIVPSLAYGVRRLHDTGRSGWWILIGIIPILGALVLLFFYLQPSK